jgi:serine/threonine-protein kinase
MRLDLGWGQVVTGDLIGEGGMGSVFRAWLYFNPQGPRAGSPPQPVAVKILHPLLVARQYVRQLFVGEANALRRLSHPNIVRFHELVEHPGGLALVIELVEGESLDKLIARHVRRKTPGSLPCLPFARAWHYFEQLLGALAATHQLGIVHRDVKPANVLLRNDGLTKLTDFGIARLPADVAKRSGGMQPGTGAYMAPEQVLGRDLDGRSDLYSASIVMYEMLTGLTPFDEESKSELMVRASQVEDLAPPVTRFLPQAPAVLDLLFARALAKEPAHRFQDAIELGDAFRKALGLPATTGWRAQQDFARHATGIVAPMAERPSTKGRTVPIPAVQEHELRDAVAGAYRS